MSRRVYNKQTNIHTHTRNKHTKYTHCICFCCRDSLRYLQSNHMYKRVKWRLCERCYPVLFLGMGGCFMLILCWMDRKTVEIQCTVAALSVIVVCFMNITYQNSCVTLSYSPFLLFVALYYSLWPVVTLFKLMSSKKGTFPRMWYWGDSIGLANIRISRTLATSVAQLLQSLILISQNSSASKQGDMERIFHSD